MLRPLVNDSIAPSDQLDAARQVLRTEAAALTSVADRLDGGFLQVVALLADCEGSVLVTGMGKSGHIGKKIAATLASTGAPAHFLHPAEAVHGDLGRITAADCVLALSHSGETAELTRILPAVRDRGASLAAICSRAGSTLGRAADAAIVYGAIEESCPLQLAPSTSCTVMLAVGDAVAFALMRQRGYGVVDFQQAHPSGSLGRLSRPVTEVMRIENDLRLAPWDRSVRSVIVAARRPGRRTGATMLIDDAGRFVGLFTDSDLVRIVETHDLTAFDRPIAEFMTRRPLVLRRDHKVFDAVAVFRERRVSELPVLDDHDRPLGIVDVTDLMDLLPEHAEAA